MLRPRPILVILALVGAMSPLRADEVKLVGKPPFKNVHFTDFADGRLAFRGVSGQILRKHLAEIEWVAFDDLPALNDAETASAARDWSAAAAGYKIAYATLPAGPRRDFCVWRHLMALEYAGDLAESLEAYLTRAMSLAAPPPLAGRPALPGSASNDRAISLLTGALAARHVSDTAQTAATISGPAVTALRRLLLELCIVEGRSPDSDAIRAAFGASENASGEKTNFGQLLSGAAKPRLPEIGPETSVFVVVEELLAQNEPEKALTLAAALRPYIKKHADADAHARLLMGRARVAAGKPAEAAADLLALSQKAPDAATAAIAVYHVALAEEKLGDAAAAANFYRDFLKLPAAPPDLRSSAEAALKRLSP